MFVYLSKKNAIPNNSQLRCVGYNKLEGFIACGGEDGLLRVLKLDSPPGEDPSLEGLAAPSNLSMNQPLEGHKGVVTLLTWNERHQKLTSGDENGEIIVWILHKGTWFEEMINSRSKAVIRSMKWNVDGQKICIAYADGAVLVGAVDGKRLWFKEMENTELTQIEWSPDSKLLLFGVAPSGEVYVYDSEGTFMSKLPIVCQSGKNAVEYRVISLEWYNGLHGLVNSHCATLAICFSNGRCQLMKSDSDMDAVTIDAGIEIVCAQWNHDGSLLAIAGRQKSSKKDLNLVKFYSPFGENLRSLKVPGKDLSFCSWDGEGVRLALAVDSFVYFANVRPDYKNMPARQKRNTRSNENQESVSTSDATSINSTDKVLPSSKISTSSTTKSRNKRKMPASNTVSKKLTRFAVEAMRNKKLSRVNYDKPCIELCKYLLGKKLVSHLPNGGQVCGKIVETEAYAGGEDMGSSTHGGRRTAGVEALYMVPGTAYCYTTCGIYTCMNISSRGDGAGVLIRSLEPLDGIDTMRAERSKKLKNVDKLKDHQLCDGPSKLTMAMNITKQNGNTIDMATSDVLYIEPGEDIDDTQIVACARIGLSAAASVWRDKPLRFYIRDNACVSVIDKKAEMSS